MAIWLLTHQVRAMVPVGPLWCLHFPVSSDLSVHTRALRGMPSSSAFSAVHPFPALPMLCKLRSGDKILHSHNAHGGSAFMTQLTMLYCQYHKNS